MRNSLPTSLPELRLREPADVLAAVPYLLGFHPTDSVVVMAVRGTRLLLNARVDAPPIGSTPAEIRDIVDDIVRLVRRQGATGAVIIGYGTPEQVTPAVQAMQTGLSVNRVRVLDALRVTGDRYWSYVCQRPECCPAEGTVFDSSSSPVAATATLSGLVALPDRAALVEQVAPVGGLARIAMRQATERAGDRMVTLLRSASDEAGAVEAIERERNQAMADALDRCRAGGTLDDDEAAWLAMLLSTAPLDSPYWITITSDLSARATHRALWSDLVRRVEPDLVPEPGTLLAFTAWCDGDGALASVALERVLAVDPGYELAKLLSETLARGVPPSRAGDWMNPTPRSARARRQDRRTTPRRSTTRRR